MLPRTEVLLVTTPNEAAQKVAGRAADMARKGHLRVAGVIENMSPFTCENGETHAIFGEGGGQRLADEIGVPLVGSVPLDAGLAAGGDAGVPVALGSDGKLAEVFAALADAHRDGDRAARRDDRLQRPAPGARRAGARTRRRLSRSYFRGPAPSTWPRCRPGRRTEAFASWRSLRRWAHIDRRAIGYLAGSTSR